MGYQLALSQWMVKNDHDFCKSEIFKQVKLKSFKQLRVSKAIKEHPEAKTMENTRMSGSPSRVSRNSM